MQSHYVYSSGGNLIFDEKDVKLQAENILITAGGCLQVLYYRL